MREREDLPDLCFIRSRTFYEEVYKMFSYSYIILNFFYSRSLTSQIKNDFIKFSKLFSIQKILPLSVIYN